MTDQSLLASVRANDLRTVCALLEQGAALDERDENGWTPLCWAAGTGNVELVRMLLERGANVFCSGKDRRTPYLIALAAGHVAAARLLSDAERVRDAVHAQSSSLQSDLRPYCMAYPIARMREFAGWQERTGLRLGSEQDTVDETADEVVFLHRDLTVTGCIWPDEDVVFDAVTDEWRDFCGRVLGFRPPHDFDLATVPRGADP